MCVFARSFPMASLKTIAVSGVFASSLVAPFAWAQSSPSTAGGRYSMHPADGGVIRLDTQTGGISMCKARAEGQWQCEALADERTALQQEIDRLANENKDLQSAVKRLEDLAGIPEDKRERHAGKVPDRSIGRVPLPTEEDVDQAMTYLRGMLKKFKDKLKEFEDLDGKRTEKL
jgi:hypothetical protein